MSADPVHVWLIDTDLPPPVLAALARLLDDDERERAGGFREERAWRRFVASHGATRLIAGRHLGAPPDQLRWQPGRHGKPELAGRWTGLQVNLSHSGELALVAVADRRPVGVDIQERAAHLDAPRLAARYFPGPEARWVATAAGPARQVDRLVRLWVRKEACVKAAGARLVPGMRLPVADDPAAGRGRGAGVLVFDPTGSLPGRWRVRDVPVPAGFRAAVALAGTGPFRLRRRRWEPEPGHEVRSERPVLLRNTSSRLGR